ncbi:MAG: type II methionyl aminopeptidase [Nanoarchaeota archaeon]|nr:type II methionyl aminopeptidase [Nanoarchaeota archaeon]
MEEDYIKAGQIAGKARDYGATLIKPGVSIIEVADKVESKIKELGGNIAFPTQMSINDVAAHQMPLMGQDMIFKEGDLVCLDVGAEYNGAIGDTATTVDLSIDKVHADLIKASREALNEALKLVKPGVELREIGKKIHEVITSYGFSPIKNLSGHGVGDYKIHTKPSIPNYDNKDTTKLVEGQTIAIEPFASDGAGLIYESGEPGIFMLKFKRPVRGIFTRKVLKEIEKFNGLPFAPRHLLGKFSSAQIMMAFREMRQFKMLEEFAALVDRGHGLVSQAEHTVIVKDVPIVTTRLD